VGVRGYSPQTRLHVFHNASEVLTCNVDHSSSTEISVVLNRRE
jgi:hypothetical protein